MSDVAIIMGSDSDWPTMELAAKVLEDFGITYTAEVLSAHRMPDEMTEFAKTAAKSGYKVIIAGAGGAAHLPGMVAAVTPLPVIGVPVKSSNSIDGWDSILSILQMPNGIPVATVALNGSKNAGILAASILSTGSKSIEKKLVTYKDQMKKEVVGKAIALKNKGFLNQFD